MTHPARKYTPDRPTKAQLHFAAEEGHVSPRDPTAMPSDYDADLRSTPQRGEFTLRRVGDAYKGEMVIHGFAYMVTASVQDDSDGKFFAGVIYEDISQPREPVALSDLVKIARDPRLTTQAAAVLNDITDVFAGE